MRLSVDKKDRAYSFTQLELSKGRVPIVNFNFEPLPSAWLLLTADEDEGMIKHTTIDEHGVLITDGRGYVQIKTAYGPVKINWRGKVQP